jgi:hypothetical protein
MSAEANAAVFLKILLLVVISSWVPYSGAAELGQKTAPSPERPQCYAFAAHEALKSTAPNRNKR